MMPLNYENLLLWAVEFGKLASGHRIWKNLPRKTVVPKMTTSLTFEYRTIHNV